MERTTAGRSGALPEGDPAMMLPRSGPAQTKVSVFMPISVRCTGCGKNLKARDDRAGNRVKCPGCGTVIAVPAIRPASRPTPDGRPAGKPPAGNLRPSASLLEAIERGNVAEIAKFLLKQDFTLVEVPEESSGGDKAALMLEVDGEPVLVAFTSSEHAARFAGEAPDFLDENGTMPAFVVEGSNLLTYLPEGCGVLLNPENDDGALIPPDVVEQIKLFASQ